MRQLFAVNPSAVLQLGLWGALSIALMTVDHRYHALDRVRDVLATAIYPLHILVRVPGDAQNWLLERWASRRTLLEENARLREKHILLNAQLQKLTTLEAENRRLRALLESAVNTPERVLIAELLSVDFNPYRHHILLNRGRQHGLYVGQPVLDQHGVVGQIIHADPLTATAILITDPNHALPIQINRNGARTLALGTGKLHELILPHVAHNEDVKVGDLLVTSGMGGRFPPGYPVGTVTAVEFDPGSPFARVLAKPSAELDRIREVMLLDNQPPIIAPEPSDAVATWLPHPVAAAIQQAQAE